MELIISNSEIASYKLCRRRWWAGEVLGYKKEQKVGPLVLGTRVHEALAAYYSPGGTADQAIQVYTDLSAAAILSVPEHELAAFEKEAKLGLTMVDGYFAWIEEEGADDGLEILDVEKEMEYTFEFEGHKVTFLAKRDAVGYDHRYGRRYFLDHKTSSNQSFAGLDLDEQVLSYAWIGKKLHPEYLIEFAIWNILRKVLRGPRAKPPFYYRLEQEISPVMLANFELKLNGVVRDIIRTKEQLESGIDHHEACYPSPGRHCEWKCPYRICCAMFDDGSRIESYLEAVYIRQAPYQRYNLMKERSEIV